MVLMLIAGAALLILGLLAYMVAQWPERSAKKKKRKKEEGAVDAPLKDDPVLVERLERRIRTLENSLQAANNEQKERLKEIGELKAAVGGLERQVEQEKAWRQKEELFVAKEKKQEHELRAEISKTRDALHEQSNQRIRLEYEVKELRLVKESLTADVRKFSGHNNELERNLKALTEDARRLNAENVKLREKKEADQWVAKDDYVKIEKLYKQAKMDIGRLKMMLPADLRDIEDRKEG